MPKPLTGVYRRPRSTRWQLRIKVPSDLASLYPTEWACRVSLETSDLREANEKAAKLWAEWTATFDEQRKAQNPQRVDQISPELAQVLAQRVYATVLAGDETVRSDPEAAKTLLLTLKAVSVARLSALRISKNRSIQSAPPAWAEVEVDPLEGLPEPLAQELGEVTRNMDQQAAFQFSIQRIAAVLPLAQSEARKLGVMFDVKTPGALGALRECLKAYRKAWQAANQRSLGEVIETPKPAALPQPTAEQSMRLRDVFKRWKGVKKRSEDSIRACERALALFEERTGNPPVQAITRAQGDDFRAWLQTLGTSSKTAHDRITWVKSLLVYAYRDLELIPRQPWEGIDIEHRTEKPRKPWSESELQAFFSLPLFTCYELPKPNFKNGGDAAYWIPLLGLFTGARVGELCQLRPEDVEQTREGAFLRISEEAEGATVKTAAGIRRVPVHRELVRLGFLEYVASLQVARATSLWPTMKLRKGKPGGYFSDWVNAFHKEATGNPKAPVFHELRHTVRTALHSAKVDREIIGRIIGHETGLSEAEKAYTHISDKDLRAAVETLKYPLKLRKVYSARGGAANECCMQRRA